MKISELEELGAFVPEEVVTRTVEWHTSNDEGEPVTHTFKVGIRKLSYGVIESATVDPENIKKSFNSWLIAATVVDNGEPVFTYEQAYQLIPGLASALLDQVRDVVGMPTVEAPEKK